MKTRVERWGNSLAIRLPIALSSWRLGCVRTPKWKHRMLRVRLVVATYYETTAHAGSTAGGHHGRQYAWRVGYGPGSRQGSLVSGK